MAYRVGRRVAGRPLVSHVAFWPRLCVVAHEVTNVGSDRHQLVNMAEQARTEMVVETLDVTQPGPHADRVKRPLLCRLFGVKRTRYAQRELFRV